MLVHKEREDFYMLKWLDKFMIGHKGFIAGGCFKNIFCKEKVKDLDIFFKSGADWEEAVNYFDSMTHGYEGDDKREEEYYFHYENDNVKAYKHIKTGIVLELINKKHGTPEEILNEFDFTIAKFAYCKVEVSDKTGEVEPVGDTKDTTHIEYKVLHHQDYFEHLHLRRLVVDDKLIFPASTFERTIRYVGYGYKPCRETKLKIMKAIHDETIERLEAPESLYDGVD